MGRGLSERGAVGLALLGFTLWVLTDTCLKYVGGARLPPYEVVAIIGAAMAIVLLVYASVRGRLVMLRPLSPTRQLLRAGLELGNVLCVVIALRHLPLALFYLLIFLSPLVTSLGAAMLLGEGLGWRQGLAIATGFAGVVIAVSPWNAEQPGDWRGYAACMVCVLCFSTNMVWSRKLTQSESRESLIFCSGLVQAVLCGAVMLHHADAVRAPVAAALVFSAVCGLLGSLCFFVALKHTSAANVAQYHYSQLLTGAVLAYWLFGERLTSAMMIGAVLIVGAGVYTATAAHPQASALIKGAQPTPDPL